MRKSKRGGGYEDDENCEGDSCGSVGAGVWIAVLCIVLVGCVIIGVIALVRWANAESEKEKREAEEKNKAKEQDEQGDVNAKGIEQ